jgi:hypothetical protein
MGEEPTEDLVVGGSPPIGKYPKEIYEGLKIPSGPTHSVKKSVKVLTVKPIMSNDQIKAREGTYFTDKDVKHLIKEDCDIYGEDEETGEKKLLAKFRKNVFPKRPPAPIVLFTLDKSSVDVFTIVYIYFIINTDLLN